MKKIFGVDLGTNSIVWALIKMDVGEKNTTAGEKELLSYRPFRETILELERCIK